MLLYRCIAEVLSRSCQCNARQLCEGVPAAQQCLSQASQALAHCSVVEQTLKEWSVSLCVCVCVCVCV